MPDPNLININPTRRVLDNGLIVNTQNIPSRVVWNGLKVNTGAINEEEGQEGIAHCIEHCIESSSTKLSTKETREIDGD